MPWAHPRSRGENRFHDRGSGHGDGSSPLTRGKRLGGCRRCLRARLIPAHAGKTGDLVGECEDRGAHPRSRGENGTGNREQGRTPGSSPLTRGKLESPSMGCASLWLIPAHAGKT